MAAATTGPKPQRAETPAADRLSDRVRGTRHRTHGLRHCLHEARDLRRRAKARGACMVGALLPARATPRSGPPRSLRARDWRRRARPLRERHTHSRGSLRARRAIRRTDHQARRPCDASEAARGSTSDCRRPPRPRFERHARDRGLVSALRPSAGSLDPTAPAAELALTKRAASRRSRSWRRQSVPGSADAADELASLVSTRRPLVVEPRDPA